MAATAVTFALNGNAAGFTRATKQARTSMRGFTGTTRRTGSAVWGLAKRISTLQTNMLGLQTVFRAFRGIKTSVTSFASFGEILLKIRAVTGSTKDEMKGIAEEIERVGLATQFSVKDIAEGVFNLGTLGLKGVANFRKMTPIIARAATTLDIDFNTAATLVLSTLKVFNLEMDKAPRVVDLLTSAYTNSSLNAEKFAVAQQYAGLAAKAFGRGLEDVLPLLMSLSDQGIDASIAGTQIRSGFLRLLKPTGEAKKALTEMGLSLKDVDVAAHGFIGVLKNLEKAQISNTQAVSIFGLRSTPIIMALLKAKQAGKTGTEALERYSAALRKTGVASAQAKLRQSGLGFAFKQASAAFDIFTTKLGEIISEGLDLEGVFQKIVAGLGSMTEWLKKIDFSALKVNIPKLFEPAAISENIFRALTQVVPKLIVLLATTAGVVAIEFVKVVARFAPAIFESLAKSFSSLLLRSVGAILSQIPGLRGAGTRLTQKANILAAQKVVFDPRAGNSLVKTIEDAQKASALDTRSLVSLSKDLLASIKSVPTASQRAVWQKIIHPPTRTKKLLDPMEKAFALTDKKRSAEFWGKTRKEMREEERKKDREDWKRERGTTKERYTRFVATIEEMREAKRKKHEEEMTKARQRAEDQKMRVETLRKEMERKRATTAAQSATIVDNSINHNYRADSRNKAVFNKTKKVDKRGVVKPVVQS